MGFFSCKNCTSVLYSVGAYLFFPMPLDPSQFLFINDLLSKGWLTYKTGSVPTSIALITGVEKKVHISAAQ